MIVIKYGSESYNVVESMLLAFVKTNRYESDLSGLSESKGKLLSMTIGRLIVRQWTQTTGLNWFPFTSFLPLLI